MPLRFSRKETPTSASVSNGGISDLISQFISSKNSIRNSVAIITLIITIWMLSGIFKKHQNSEDTEVKIATVKAIHSSPVIKSSSIELNGFIKSHLSTELKAEVDGIVSKLNAKDGQFLKKGQTIIQLKVDNRQYEYSKAEAELQKHKLNYDAILKLKEKGLSSDAQVNTANANLKLAESEFNKAALALDKTKIKAPFDGFIDEIKVSRGDYISAGNNVIGTYTATSPLTAVSFIPQNEIDKFKDAEIAVVHTKDNEEVMAEVHFISKVANPSTRSFVFEARFENFGDKFQIGESVKIQLFSKASSITHKIPKSSLVLDSKGKLSIKVVSENNTVKNIKVDLVDEDSEHFWVSGLDTEADIITLGANLVNEGEKVNLDTKI